MIRPPCTCGKSSCHMCRTVGASLEYQRLYGLLPPIPLCVYEGKVIRIECPQGFENYHVRDCEHPAADWDFCMRRGENKKDGVHNCETCTIRPTPAE